MKKNKIKVLSLVLAFAFCMTSCSSITDLLGGDKSADEVEEVMTTYMENIVAGKYDKAAKHVVDGESLIASAELDDDHEAILGALTSSTEFEISDVSAEKEKSGKCTLTITVVDIEAALEDVDATDADAVIAAIEDCDDTTEEEFTVKFTYDDEWLIKDSSSIENLYIDAASDVEISALTEDAAVEFLVESLEAACSGDVEAAFNLTRNDESTYTDYDEYVAEAGDSGVELVQHLFECTTYTIESSSLEEDYVEITVVYSLPDVQESMNSIYTDELLASVMAVQMFNPEDEAALEEIREQMMDDFYVAMESASRNTTTCVYRVSLDENNEMVCENYDVPDLVDNESISTMSYEEYMGDRDPMELVYLACDEALNRGYITQDEYDALMGSAEASENGETTEEVMDILENPTENSIDIQEGDDYYQLYFYEDSDCYYSAIEYSAGDEGIFMKVWSWDYYDAGSTMSADVYFNGSFVETLTYTSETDSNDRGYLNFVPNGGLQVGTYSILIYGYNGEMFAAATVAIAE